MRSLYPSNPMVLAEKQRRVLRFFRALATLLLLGAVATAHADGGRTGTDRDWLDDYHAALDHAEESGRMALLWFHDRHDTHETERFEREVLHDPDIAYLLDSTCICVKLPIDATIVAGDDKVQLLEHAAFAAMERMPGLVMIDMTEESSPLFRQVVSVYPFRHQQINADKLAVMLELPRGTLTQRTLIFAVHTHPEQPASAASDLSPVLLRETERHALHQASIVLQGHHNWESRFHAINAQLPDGLLAREVCAESWPGQSLVEAAEECVASWRKSPGHWDLVSRRHAFFGYDMKRGRNGTWYAAGIFAGAP